MSANTPVPANPDGSSVVHRLGSHLKVLALVGFVLAVIATPREHLWPHMAHLALVLAIAAVARVSWRYMMTGLRIETPFVLAAILMPFVATGPTTEILGVTVSRTGLWGAWSLIAKATLGVLAGLTLAATTQPPALLNGLRRLGLPSQLVEIMGLMIRYVDVVGEQWRRMGVARTARGFRSTTPASWPALGRSLGTLFIRSYERGERVHLAMLSRGYTGTMPTATPAPTRASDWAKAALLPTAAALVTAAAWRWT